MIRDEVGVKKLVGLTWLKGVAVGEGYGVWFWLKFKRNEIANIVRYLSELGEGAKEGTGCLLEERREKLEGLRRTIIHNMIMICVRTQ